MGSVEKKIWIVLTVGVILLIGTTFAWFYWNSTTNTNVSLNVDGITVNYEGGTDITGVNLIPVSSKEKGVADNTAIEKVVTASCTTKLYLNLYLTLETLPDGLKDESFVYEVYKGANLVGSGDFKNYNQGDVIELATHQEITSTESSFQIYIWIDGNKNNPSTMMNQTFKFVLSADATTNPNLDNSGANEPKLVDGLIPVMYNGSNWVKTSSSNDDSTYQWYDYNNKKWANAVLVTDTNRSTYQSARNGTVIPESDILAYYVWIPRYKYKVWNITKTVGTDSYNARTTGIDIVFESGTATTGTITCNDYSFAAPTADTPNQTCSGTNGEYYTHPAFTFGDSELEGIWVGKFEVSSSNPTAENGETTTTLTVRVKPSTNSWRYNYVDNFSYVIQNMQASSNEYGLTTDKNKADSHMLKNMEWGAVAYLTNSNYGRCSNGTCTEVAINSYKSYKTGCGPQSAGSTSSGSTCNEYTTELGQTASTTGNVYGIYDMSGGAYEYVMGNQSSGSGSYTYNASYAGSNFAYSTETAKYLDTYAYGTSYDDQTAYNRARLGDATGENVLSTGEYGGWSSDYARFVYSDRPWFIRGGRCISALGAGVFSFNRDDGDAYYEFSARAALLAL